MKSNLSKARLFWAIISIILPALTLISCRAGTSGVQAKPVPEGKLTVAVSILPQRGFVTEVAGNLAETAVLVPPSQSPENYALTPKELVKLSNSKVYFALGIPVEKNLLPRLTALNKDIKIVDLASEVNAVYPDLEFAPGERDPHIWLSPKRVKIIVSAIARELSFLDPAHKEVYQSNAQEYQTRLDELDQKIRTLLAAAGQKKFIVYHPSCGYFADDYGLTMYAIEEEGKEASIPHLQEIINLARQHGIKVIFYQAESDGKQARVAAEEIGGRTQLFEPLAENYLTNLEKMAAAFTGSSNTDE